MRQPLMLLDEPSAYLDPAATRQLLQIVKRLNAEYGYTFIVVTHDMELVTDSRRSHDHAGRADRGRRQTARTLTDRDLLAGARLEPPMLTRMFSELSRSGGAPSDIPLTIAEAKALLHGRSAPDQGPSP